MSSYLSCIPPIQALESKETNLHSLKLLRERLTSKAKEIYPSKLFKFHKAYQDFIHNRISLSEYIQVLSSRESQVAGSKDRYPSLHLIFETKEKEETKKLLETIEARKLFQEIEAFTQEIKSQLIPSPLEGEGKGEGEVKTLDSLFSRLHLLEKLASLEISRPEWNLKSLEE